MLTTNVALHNLWAMPTAPDLIGSAEACKILGIERSTLVRWVQLRQIRPAKKLPGPVGPYLYRRSDVERLAEQRKAAST